MKHLFLVHSHITYLVAMQVMKVKALAPEDCLILLDRGYQPAQPTCPSVAFPYQSYPRDSFALSPLFWTNWFKMLDLDKWIEETTSGQHFQWYVPQSGMNFFYLITNHPLCKGFYFLEEGTAAYRDSSMLNSIKPPSALRQMLYWLNFRGRSPYQKAFFDVSHPKYMGCFAMSEMAFAGFRNKTIVPNPFAGLQPLAEATCVLVLESLVAYQMLSEETYRAILRKVFEHAHASGIQSLHFKGPTLKADFEDLQHRTLELFRQEADARNIHLTELPANFPLESLCASNSAVRFYLLTSSVGIYASMFGKEVVSHLPMALQLEPSFASHLKGVPMNMWKDFLFLDAQNKPTEIGLG